jgi:DNA-binding winged helix-turn-helix (wHTH) protein/tetratricopeptide (TPR) repeat protein
MDETCFDGWTLRRDSGELIRDGRTIRLAPQLFGVLDALLARPGEVVTRDELVARLWPKGIVEFDVSLNTAVRRLRATLADDAEHPRYIETVPRRGYRFIGRIDSPHMSSGRNRSRDLQPALPARVPRRWLVGLLGTATATAAVAVAFALSAVQGTANAPAAAAEPPPSASSIKPAELEAAVPEAAERYRRARFMLDRRGSGDLERAQHYLGDVVTLTPGFAPAHAALASVHFLEAVQGKTDWSAGLARARQAADLALSLDPELVEAHLRLASIASLLGDPTRRDAHFARASALEPAHPMVLAWRGSVAMSEQRLEDAVQLLQRASTADALNLPLRYNLGAALFAAGRFHEAERVIREMMEIDPRHRADLLAELAIVGGRPMEAVRIASAWPDDAAKWQYLALALHSLAKQSEADAALRRLIDEYGGSDPLRVAEVYAFRGERDAAFHWLARHRPSSAPRGGALPRQSWALRHSPYVSVLRDDVRWRQWLARDD